MYSFVYGIVVGVGTLILAQFIDGRIALVIGLVLLALRWWHLKARADFERGVFGASVGDLKQAKAEFERRNPGATYTPPSREELRARARTGARAARDESLLGPESPSTEFDAVSASKDE